MKATACPRSCRAGVPAALLCVVLLAGSGFAAGVNTLTPRELAQGWILLFDGQTLFGWRASSEANWRVAGGVISADEGQKGLLYTTSQFGDYVLKVDFRSGAGANSGVFLRTSPHPTDVTRKCYELNIADVADNPFPTGSFVQRRRAQGNHDSTDWQTFEITADGPHFLVRLDGQTVLDYTDPKPLGRGFIGLQFNTGKIEFRNVKLRPLGMKRIFNGKNLQGWKTFPQLPSVFSVTPEGWLNVKNGRGMLETQAQYEDFTLQLEAIVNGTDLNSGIFFRCIPGETMNGYECQIHNGYLDGDRTKPKDCGTGGIFRRQNARKVVANDRQWFHQTLHVDDRHMAAWVDGYQVSDWSDPRQPDENPRRGLRLKAGTIQIQGHDPTTDFSFRNIRIAEIPPR